MHEELKAPRNLDFKNKGTKASHSLLHQLHHPVYKQSTTSRRLLTTFGHIVGYTGDILPRHKAKIILHTVRNEHTHL